MCYIKDMFTGNQDKEYIHQRFIKYSRGEFDGPVVVVKTAKNKIKVTGSYDYLNTITEVILANSEGKISASGKVLSQEKIDSDILENTKKSKGRYVSQVNGVFDAKGLLDLVRNNITAYFILKLDGEGFKLKAKNNPPKPGGKIETEFFSAELPESLKGPLTEELLFKELSTDFKEIDIQHRYVIEEIVIPAECRNDSSKARLNAKRKGVAKRVVKIDGGALTVEKKILV